MASQEGKHICMTLQLPLYMQAPPQLTTRDSSRVLDPPWDATGSL